MSTSVKSLITTALTENRNLDPIKREFMRRKVLDAVSSATISVASRHHNTLQEAVEAFSQQGVQDSQISFEMVHLSRKTRQTANIQLSGFPLTLIEDSTELLLRYPFNHYSYNITYKKLSQVAETFVAIANQLSLWEEEWNALVSSCAKRAKTKAMNEVSIETVLRSRLKGTGLKFSLRKQQYRVALTLVMKRNIQATFLIQHSKFRQQLDKVLPAVQQLNELMDDLGQPIKMKTLSRSTRWESVDED